MMPITPFALLKKKGNEPKVPPAITIIFMSSCVFCVVGCSSRVDLVAVEGAADASPHLALDALGAAGAHIGGGVAGLAAVDVAGTADTDVAHGGLVAGSDAVVLLVEREGRALASLVGVASSTNTAEEAARGSDGRHGVRRSLVGVGDADNVAGTTAAGAHESGGGGGGLGDDVVGHFDRGGCLGVRQSCVKKWVGEGASNWLPMC